MAFEHAELRRKIIEDVLGDSYEEYENFSKDEATKGDSKRQHRQRIPLWRFLLHLLNRDKTGEYIEWDKEKPLEFRIRNTTGVAELWGSVKNKSDMTYEKLGRAMRYYYGKNVIEKVSGRRYSYRFIPSRRTKKHLAQFIDVNKINYNQNITANVSENDDNGSESSSSDENGPETPPASPKCQKEESGSLPCSNNNDVKTKTKPSLFEQHTIGKTKIFRPDELMFRSLNNFSKPNEKRLSAFSVPEKRQYVRYVSLPEQPIIYSKQPYAMYVAGEKRYFVDGASRMSEPYIKYMRKTELLASPASFPEYRRVYSTPQSSEDFILRRETSQDELQKHEMSVLKFQRHLSLNYMLDNYGCSSKKDSDESITSDDTRKYLFTERQSND